jgi:ferredoxin
MPEGACGRVTAAEREPKAPKIRPSRVGKWRAASLVLVHVLVAVHVAHWLSTGSTLSPLEPSESGDFCRDGIVNAGLVFFLLTIATTLVLGRWFCGWACHIVALQDLCRWLLLRVGLRPRPVQLGVLAWVPWLALLHMLFSPLVNRWLAGEATGVETVALTTESFWQTFPGPAVALLTFFVCGFAIVWLLGAKGFCTYGCPYGAIFGIADQLAPARIRVTSACNACGHCTAVCSSNVNVSQEVRDFGTVVDPGCMKCMDCVSVCPEGALYFGWGKPALVTTSRRPETRTPPFWGWRRALEAVFVLATFALFDSYNGRTAAYIDRPEVLRVLLGAAPALLVGWIFRGRARRAGEFTLREEALLAGLFLLSLFLFRGHGWVPFLCALGLSTVGAYLAFQGLRLLYRSDIRLQSLKLKSHGRLQRSGALYCCALALLLGGSAWMGVDQVRNAEEARAALRQGAEGRRSLRQRASALYEEGLRAVREQRLEDALHAFRTVLEARPDFVAVRANLASVLCATGRFEEGLAECERALRQSPDDSTLHELAWRACDRLADPTGARAHLEAAVRLAPEREDLTRALAAAKSTGPP